MDMLLSSIVYRPTGPADILYKLIWDIAFAQNSIFQIDFDDLTGLTLKAGLDMTGFLEDYGISFTGIEHIVYIFAIQFIVLKFVKKLIDVYGMQTDGDANADIVTVVINFCKAMVIAMSFTVIWGWIYDIVYDFAKQVINAVSIVGVNYTDMYDQLKVVTENNSGATAYVLTPVITILNSILAYMQMKNGVELWILRLGLPLACVGLLDADQGIFKQYIKLMLKVVLTVVIQSFVVNAGMCVLYLANTTGATIVFFFIALMIIIVGFTTPKTLSELLMPHQGGGGRIMSVMYIGSMLFRG